MLRGHLPIWITGLGAITPIGCGFDHITEGFLQGRSGIQRISRFSVKDYPSQIAGQLGAIPCPPELDASAWAICSRLHQMALFCAARAIGDAGLDPRQQVLRVGLILGLGTEWLSRWEMDHHDGGRLLHEPQRGNTPIVETVRSLLGLQGPSASVAAACASGNYALALARRWLQQGLVDVCLAGALDSSVSPLGMAGFGNLRALSRRNDAPEQASRPFDRGRDGFVLGEGGAVFVLEPAERASKRSARAYAELAGCGATSDAHNMVIPCPDPGPAARAMELALVDARIAIEDVSYVNAHATSTPVGDVAETRVLERVFGSHLSEIPISSTKSMTGHCLTAAAAVEALACLAAIERQAIPPTINLDDPDPECKLNHVAHQAREQKVKVALSNSFGFGGSNTCIVLRAA